MKYIIAIVLLMGVTGVMSCKKKSNNYVVTGDYMIVGWAGGYTTADAVSTFYLISGGQLREDRNVRVYTPPTDISKFNFNSVLPEARYNAVKHLPASIPAELLAKNGQIIGNMMPDAGYTDVRMYVNGTVYAWKFEGNQDSSSIPVQQFVQDVTTLF